MGNSNPTQVVNQRLTQQQRLIADIRATAGMLMQEYRQEYLDPGFCNRVALVYNDKLRNFRKDELEGVSYTLGLQVQYPAYKQRMCDAIVKHYTDRFNLLAAIVDSLSYCDNRIRAAVTGPVCAGQPEIFDPVSCQANAGSWQTMISPPDGRLPENAQWYTYLNQMQTQYMAALERLQVMVHRLAQMDQDIRDPELQQLRQEAAQLIQQTTLGCQQAYYGLLTAPTRTPADLRRQRQQSQYATSQARARQAALRTTQGLTAVSAKHA
jgi:hypothetical protein